MTMSWNMSRSSCSPSGHPGPVHWNSTVNVVNPVMVMGGGWHPGNIWQSSSDNLWPPPGLPSATVPRYRTPDPVPLPVQALMTGRSMSVMTGSIMDDFASAVPTQFSQFDEFMTATPTSGFRDFESTVTMRNENEYENDFYDDLTELRTDFDVPEIMFESSSCCSTESCDSSEGYPANFFQVVQSIFQCPLCSKAEVVKRTIMLG